MTEIGELITTTDQLDALPTGTILVDHQGDEEDPSRASWRVDAWQKVGKGTFWCVGDGRDHPPVGVIHRGPLRAVWMPEQPKTEGS